MNLKLAPAARSASRARTTVRDALPSQISDEVRYTAGLLVSELVTNAILHVGAAVEVDVHVREAGTVRVDVRDPSPFAPRRREPGLDSTGRGLVLLDALADRWGVDMTDDGKSVWFELDFAVG